MAKISALKMVPTAKLPGFHLKATDTLHCFLTEGAANSFAMSQLSMAHEQRLRSWGVDDPAHPDKQIGIGMSFIRYDIELPDVMVQQMTRAQHNPNRPTNYIGTVQPNGVHLPQPAVYLIGKDDAGKFQKLPADVDIAAVVQERKDICTQKQEATAHRLAEKEANAEARRAEGLLKAKASREASLEELKSDPNESTPGSYLIVQHQQMLSENSTYASFTRNLEASYKARLIKDVIDDSGMKAAHEALIDVYGQIRKVAVQRNDFEMATFAHNTIEAANSYLIGLDHERKYGEDQGQGFGMSREDAAAYGIYIPERDEW